MTSLAELIAARGSTAPILPRGSRVKKLLVCAAAPCIAARAADASDRGRIATGYNYVPSEMTGVVACVDCGTEWPVGESER